MNICPLPLMVAIRPTIDTVSVKFSLTMSSIISRITNGLPLQLSVGWRRRLTPPWRTSW